MCAFRSIHYDLPGVARHWPVNGDLEAMNLGLSIGREIKLAFCFFGGGVHFFFGRPGSLPWFLQLKYLICCIL